MGKKATKRTPTPILSTVETLKFLKVKYESKLEIAKSLAATNFMDTSVVCRLLAYVTALDTAITELSKKEETK